MTTNVYRSTNSMYYKQLFAILGLTISVIYLIFLPPRLPGLITASAGALCMLAHINRVALGAYLLLWGPIILGALFRCFGFEQIGTIIAYPLAFLFLHTSKRDIHHFPFSTKPLIGWWFFALLTLLAAYVHGPMSSYSTSKLLFITFYFAIAFLAFLYITTSAYVDLSSLGLFAVTAGTLHLATIGYRIPHMMPSSILEPTGLRLSIVFREHALPETNSLAYLACSAVLLVISGRIDKSRSSIDTLLSIVACLFAALIVLSVGQRTWFFALALGAFVLLLAKPKSKRFCRLIATSLIILMLSGIGLAIISGSRIIAPIYEGLVYGDKSLTVLIDREKNWDSAIHRITEKPLIGHGLGGYYVDGYSDPGGGTYAHNLVLELLSETGLIGTIIILIPPIFLFVLPQRRFIVSFRTRAGGTMLPLLAMWFTCSMTIWDLKFSSHLFAMLSVLWLFYSIANRSFVIPRVHKFGL
jgi:O-antigen ligase